MYGKDITVYVQLSGDIDNPRLELTVYNEYNEKQTGHISSFQKGSGNVYSVTWSVPKDLKKGYYYFEVYVTDTSGTAYITQNYSLGEQPNSSTSSDDGHIRTFTAEYTESRNLAYFDLSVYESSNTDFKYAEFRVYDPDRKEVSQTYLTYSGSKDIRAELDTRNLKAGTYTVRAETFDRSNRSMDYMEKTFKIGTSKPGISNMKAINDKTNKTDISIGDSIKVSADVSGDDVRYVYYELRVNGYVVDEGETRGSVRSPYVVWDTSRVGNVRSDDRIEVYFFLKDSSKRDLESQRLRLDFSSEDISIKINNIPRQYNNDSGATININATITGDRFTETVFVFRNETAMFDISTGQSFVITDATSFNPTAQIRLPLTGNSVQGNYSVTAIVYHENKEVARDQITFTILKPC